MLNTKTKMPLVISAGIKIAVMLLIQAMPAWASETVTTGSTADSSYQLDIDINVIGAEAAAKQLSQSIDALTQNLSTSLNQQTLSQEQKQQLEKTLSTLQNVSTSLSQSDNPIHAIVADASATLRESIEASVNTIKIGAIDPTLNKARNMLWIAVATIVLLLTVVAVFIIFYLIPTVNNLSNTTRKVAETIAILPDTIDRLSTQLATHTTRDNLQQEHSTDNANIKSQSPTSTT